MPEAHTLIRLGSYTFFSLGVSGYLGLRVLLYVAERAVDGCRPFRLRVSEIQSLFFAGLHHQLLQELVTFSSLNTQPLREAQQNYE